MGAPSGVTTYLYNSADQLTSANGVAHTWDANGNLLHDGVILIPTAARTGWFQWIAGARNT
ncbi:MAG: hypothetical protein JXA78_14620 [Anaerolineales bacterium]|nr:hypothetical protein [Anaerolineales bacterium]